MVTMGQAEIELEVEATPEMVIDLAVVDRNIERLADYARRHGIAVRPHTKTHKSLYMACRQISAGAVGLTAAKAGEAEVMAAACEDVLVAYPAIDPHRVRRLVRLARRGVTVRVALDSVQGIDAVAAVASDEGATIGVLVDLDVGFHRTGAQSPMESLHLARHVAQLDALRLDGIFFYPGHVWSPAAEQVAVLAQIDAILGEAIELWRGAGLEARIVSGGSTPTAYQSQHVRSQTEIRPGTYLYNDMNTARAGFCAIDDCAARIVCTVVSTAVPGKAIIDAGTKVLTSDRNVRFPDSGYGYVVEYPDVPVVRLSEEHGELDVSRSARVPRVGERVTVIPNHICPCVNLRDSVWLRYADGRLEAIEVDARGRVS
jgi:D-serine deaminase-like pyridoxal phosphate-dependent protein